MLRKGIVLLTVLLLLTAALPSVSADGGPQAGTWYTGSGEWGYGCDEYGGGVLIQVNFSMPAGYVQQGVRTSDSPTFHEHYTWSYAPDGSASGVGIALYMVPPHGDTHYSIQVYAPDGTFLTTADLYASCVTGEIRVTFGDIYGINQPAANQRVAAAVLTDTPLYSTPGTVIPGLILKAGQSWFVVGQTTDDSGAVWYKVFVGGPNLAYVPAAALSLSGPVPSGFNGTSPDPAPFPAVNLHGAVG